MTEPLSPEGTGDRWTAREAAALDALDHINRKDARVAELEAAPGQWEARYMDAESARRAAELLLREAEELLARFVALDAVRGTQTKADADSWLAASTRESE